MINYKRLSILILLFLFFNPVFANSKTNLFKTPGVLTICNYSEFKPVSYSNGKGYEPDLLRAVAKLWKVKIRFYSEDVYEGIWRLPSRKYTACDIAIGGISDTELRRKQHAVFSMPTAHYKQSLLVRTKDFQDGAIRSFSDFKYSHRKIGVVPGTAGEDFANNSIREAGIDPGVVVQYASESELLPALKEGKIYAIARGEVGNDYQASLNPDFTVIAKKDVGETFSFVVNPARPELLKELNSAIETLTQHGQIGFSSWLKNHNIFDERVDKNTL